MVNLTSVYEQELYPQHFHYNRLQRHIRETLPHIKITSIRQVHNKYLSLAFAVKENEMRQRNDGPSTITEYIHATGATKVPSILKGNLDWRLVTRSKYGQGVSFSHSASYANKYCNNRNGCCRAFVFCDVLVGKIKYVYDNFDTHPPKNIDSYENANGFVFVKFDDFTFNPKFVVYYEEGGYNTDSYSYNDIHIRQRDFNDSSAHDQIRNQEQRSLLRQILRIPFQNEDFLNKIVAETNKLIQIVVKPTPIELPIQPPVVAKDPERIEIEPKPSVTKNDSELIEEDTRPVIPDDWEPWKAYVGGRRLPFFSTDKEERLRQIERFRALRDRMREIESREAPPSRKCKKFSLIMLPIVITIACLAIFYYLYTRIYKFT